ncbi:MAG: PDZ domain-containing protein, partial [Mariprofundus sp.]
VDVEIIRDGKNKVIPVILEAMPDDQVASTAGKNRKKEAEHGLVLEKLSAEAADALRARTKYGVVVRQVMRGSPAARSGIERGDVIVKVNGRIVKTPKAFEKQAKVMADGVALRVLIDRHGDQVFTVIYPPGK